MYSSEAVLLVTLHADFYTASHVEFIIFCKISTSFHILHNIKEWKGDSFGLLQKGKYMSWISKVTKKVKVKDMINNEECLSSQGQKLNLI